MRDQIQKLNIRGIISKLFTSIPAKNKEILERRFGIGTESPETLESIGKSRHITRERVRQIQEYGLKKILQSDKSESLAPLFENIREYLTARGGVAREDDVFNDLARKQDCAHLGLLLKLAGGDIIFAKETDGFHARYAVDRGVLEKAETLVKKMHDILGEHKAPMAFDQILSLASKESQSQGYGFNGDPVLANVLSTSRLIKQGPFGEYGLADWARISPRGVKDKAHLVFEREKRPLHFREISALIDKYFAKISNRKTHPQTVHNELIKDPRFVLIGRGLYGLAEWGYEPGTVKDVLVQVLKEQGKPLSREELFDFASERRFVKPNTVFLNLQNKHYFRKVEEGKYYLA